jgi:hypothetical protein
MCGGCPACSYIDRAQRKTSTTAQFIEKASAIHNNKYDYSETVYVKSFSVVKIKCKSHGIFAQTARDHLSGCGCPDCGKTRLPGKYDDNYFLNSTKRQTTPAILYLIQSFDCNIPFYKIGITVRTVTKRFSGKLKKMKLVDFKTLPLHEAYKLEQTLLLQLSQYKYLPTQKFNGHTECFICDDYVVQGFNAMVAS